MGLLQIDPSEKPDILTLLESQNLPVSDVSDQILFYKWMDENIVSGYAGTEVFGKTALLRSVVILPEKQKAGTGREMITDLLDHLKKSGISEVYLLTATAEGFFSKLGFSIINRSNAPEDIQATSEFKSVCPSSAIFMIKELK